MPALDSRELFIRDGRIWARESFESSLGRIEDLIAPPPPPKPAPTFQLLPAKLPAIAEWAKWLALGSFASNTKTYALFELESIPMPGGYLRRFAENRYFAAQSGATDRASIERYALSELGTARIAGAAEAATPTWIMPAEPLRARFPWGRVFLFAAIEKDVANEDVYLAIKPNWDPGIYTFPFPNVFPSDGRICMGGNTWDWDGSRSHEKSAINSLELVLRKIEDSPFNNDLRRNEQERSALQWDATGSQCGLAITDANWRPAPGYLTPITNEPFVACFQAAMKLGF